MKLFEAVSKYLKDQFSRLPEIYPWGFNLENFPNRVYHKSGVNKYEQSRHLRDHIYNAIQKNSNLSEELQKWYVRDFGGVRGNSDETLNRYITSDYQELLDLGTRGVASWSKILSVRNPKEYAIYDARVALSLNSIQKIYSISDRILFPQLPSRNTTFVLPTQEIIRQSDFFKTKNNKNYYSKYLEMLQFSVCNQQYFDIQDAEMILFSNAEELSRVWRP